MLDRFIRLDLSPGKFPLAWTGLTLGSLLDQVFSAKISHNTDNNPKSLLRIDNRH
jgi:hypothetical protein